MSTVGSSARNARPMAVRRSALVPATTTALKLGANLVNSAPQLYTKDAGHTDQRWAKAARCHLAGIPLISRQEQRDKLHGFTQAHLIGQNAAKTLVTQRVQPLEAFDLIRAQNMLETIRHFIRLRVDDLEIVDVFGERSVLDYIGAVIRQLTIQ